jgi:hypothetical protein
VGIDVKTTSGHQMQLAECRPGASARIGRLLTAALEQAMDAVTIRRYVALRDESP